MGTFSLLPLVLALTVGSPPTGTVDLTEIPRSIAKEPTYQTRDPKYCLLVLGPRAETRIWIVLDGKTLYVDRNGNGNLTEAGKQVTSSGATFAIGGIKEAGARTRHLQLWMRQRADKSMRLIFTLDKQVQQYVGFDSEDPFQMGDRPQRAPIIHLDGPLTARLYDAPPTFVAGQAVELDLAIGTPGLGKGAFAAIQCCTVLSCNTAPFAEITFPHRDPKREPIVTQVTLPED
jgi:hypothetical protein